MSDDCDCGEGNKEYCRRSGCPKGGPVTAPLDTAADRALAESLDGSQNTRLVRARFIATLDALDAATARAELLECALSELVALDDGDTPELWRFEEVFTRARAALSGREGV